MSFSVFLLILLSALLHTAWNVLSKTGKPSIAFFMMMCAGNTLLWSWTLFFFDLPYRSLGAGFYLAYFISIFSEYFYFAGIVETYRLLDISLGYPMVRSLPILLITLITFVFPPHRIPGGTGFCGLLLVISGCLLLPHRRFKDILKLRECRGAMRFIWMAVCGTTGYTIGDAFALQRLQSCAPGNEIIASCFYLFLIQGGNAAFLACRCFADSSGKQGFRELCRKQPFKPLLAGFFSSLAYVLILYSMLHVTQLSFLQAFRQVSLPCGVLAGMLIFKEKVTIVRWAGVFLVVTGLITIALQ